MSNQICGCHIVGSRSSPVVKRMCGYHKYLLKRLMKDGSNND